MQLQATEQMESRPDREFGGFFKSEYPRLVRALLPTTGGLAEAEEAAQEAMVRIFERWARVREMDSPAAYTYTVGLNVHRRRQRRSALQRRILPVLRNRVSPAPDVETRDELLRALTALPAHERDALLLVTWYGLDSSEAAVVLGIESPSVRSRIHRARKTLQGLLNEEVDHG